MITLKEAREKGKMKQFIKEREKDPPGDAALLEKTIKKIAKTSRANPKSSAQAGDDS